MKILRQILPGFLILTALVAPSALAQGKKQPGPHGGRLLTAAQPPVEFLVTPERHVQITFLDASGQPATLSGPSVTVTTGSRSAPVVLTFKPAGAALLSEQPVPEGRSLPAVVQLKRAPDAPEVVERFHINLAKCPECSYAEYACICGH